MRKLLIATTRLGKIEEFADLLGKIKLRIITLKDLCLPLKEPKETGTTYQENALIKAKFYGKKTKLLTLTDDTGLEVKALPGKLGLQSKRYFLGSDKKRVKKLLAEMKHIPDNERTAFFCCALCLYDPKINQAYFSFGKVYGNISKKIIGRRGFGYDSVFIVKNLNKTFAQMNLQQKNQISHRAKAVKKMLKNLYHYEN